METSNRRYYELRKPFTASSGISQDGYSYRVIAGPSVQRAWMTPNQAILKQIEGYSVKEIDLYHF